jgi:hypothetical protein
VNQAFTFKPFKTFTVRALSDNNYKILELRSRLSYLLKHSTPARVLNNTYRTHYTVVVL